MDANAAHVLRVIGEWVKAHNASRGPEHAVVVSGMLFAPFHNDPTPAIGFRIGPTVAFHKTWLAMDSASESESDEEADSEVSDAFDGCDDGREEQALQQETVLAADIDALHLRIPVQAIGVHALLNAALAPLEALHTVDAIMWMRVAGPKTHLRISTTAVPVADVHAALQRLLVGQPAERETTDCTDGPQDP